MLSLSYHVASVPVSLYTLSRHTPSPKMNRFNLGNPFLSMKAMTAQSAVKNAESMNSFHCSDLRHGTRIEGSKDTSLK